MIEWVERKILDYGFLLIWVWQWFKSSQYGDGCNVTLYFVSAWFDTIGPARVVEVPFHFQSINKMLGKFVLGLHFSWAGWLCLLFVGILCTPSDSCHTGPCHFYSTFFNNIRKILSEWNSFRTKILRLNITIMDWMDCHARRVVQNQVKTSCMPSYRLLRSSRHCCLRMGMRRCARSCGSITKLSLFVHTSSSCELCIE